MEFKSGISDVQAFPFSISSEKKSEETYMKRQSDRDDLQVAARNDSAPVSTSGREEDLKIAPGRLAGKANKSHSSLLRGQLSLSRAKRSVHRHRCNALLYAVSN